MPRPNKEALDYFELDCQLDDKIRLIQAEFGLKGFAIVVKLLQKIYGTRGYYCEWNEEVLLLFTSENGLTGDGRNLIENIIEACIKRNIFSEDLYTAYGILTSSGIQQRYVNAVSRRANVKMKKEYLLVSVPKNLILADSSTVSVDRNSINDDRNSQRRKEKRRKEKRREEYSIERVRNPASALTTPKATMRDLIDLTDFSDELKSVIKDWASYKIQKRQSYKELGFKKLLSEIAGRVDRHGERAVIDVINLSMSNNWQGIIWDRITEKAAKRGESKLENLREWMNE